MTRLVLIRHAATDCFATRIAGRDANVHLSASGTLQGQHLARSLKQLGIAKVYSSPQPRALETAEFLGELGDGVQIAPQLDEIDYGEWTGRSFKELRSIARWRDFNSLRSCTRVPGGELMIEVQARVLGLMESLCQGYPATTIALVSHADVIRGALAHCLGMPLDFVLRLEISPASISMVAMEQDGPRVLCINATEEFGE
ncbi:MAG TPA: histidine phosphatase family protein [Gammaproteobacteria bacterium]|nr:histidine phosphatase family protein [Gammaproteobacteria bacterium]